MLRLRRKSTKNKTLSPERHGTMTLRHLFRNGTWQDAISWRLVATNGTAERRL